MYSYPGPVTGLFGSVPTTGKEAVAVRPVSGPRLFSQPDHAVVQPRVHRNESSSTVASVSAAGSLVPVGVLLTVWYVLPPRFGGSYILLWLPLLGSKGCRM